MRINAVCQIGWDVVPRYLFILGETSGVILLVNMNNITMSIT